MAIDEKVYVGPDTLKDFKNNLARVECYASNIDLVGHTVTAEKDDMRLTAVIGRDEKAILRLPKIGTWKISEDLYESVQMFDLPYYGDYRTMVGGDIFITVNYEKDFNYTQITLTNGEDVRVQMADSTGYLIFCVATRGTWTVSATVDGKEYSTTITCEEAGDYSVSLKASKFDYKEWLEAGGISSSGYVDLDDVLRDEKAIRILMTKHASVDFLAEISNENEEVEKIINNDLCAKWINLRDYALDTLYANPIIKGYMDTADKYFYGEWALVNQVPKMTSNTAPYGETFADFEKSSNPKYFAFNGDKYSFWYSYGGDDSARTMDEKDKYIGYKFTENVRINGFSYYLLNAGDSREYNNCNLDLQYSDDGNTWKTLESFNLNAKELHGQIINFYTENNNESHKYWRIFTKTGNGIGYYSNNPGYYFSAGYVQFFSWQPKGNVPVMTSNTAPYGEASASMVYSSDFSAWKAFNNSYKLVENVGWGTASSQSGSNQNQRLSYEFTNPCMVKKSNIVPFYASSYMKNRTRRYKYQASNDGLTWVDISDEYTFEENDFFERMDLMVKDGYENDKYYFYYALFVISSGSNEGCGCNSLQFYGRELSVSVPIMTSNTTPWGEAICSSEDPNFPLVNAFSRNSVWMTGRGGTTDSNIWLGFDYKQPIKPKHITAWTDSGNVSSTYVAQGFVDNNWIDISDEFTYNGEGTIVAPNIKDVVCSKIRIYIKKGTYPSSAHGSGRIGYVIMAGLDYSEHDERHYIYDHGVEVEEIIAKNIGGGFVHKETNELNYKIDDGNGDNFHNFSSIVSKISFDNVSLMRALIGTKYIKPNAGTPYWGVSDNILDIGAENDLSSIASSAMNSNGDIFLDVKNVIGEHNAFCAVAYYSNEESSIKEWWLE